MSASMQLHVALSMRLDAIEAYRLAHAYRDEVIANTRAKVATALDLLMSGEGYECAHLLNQIAGDTAPAPAAEAYDGELAMYRHLIRTLRLSARQGDLPAVQQALDYHAVDDANARDAAKTKDPADFFQPEHTYAHGDYRFKCEHLVTHPTTGHTAAWGWFGQQGNWRHASFSRRQYEVRVWTDITGEVTP